MPSYWRATCKTWRYSCHAHDTARAPVVRLHLLEDADDLAVGVMLGGVRWIHTAAKALSVQRGNAAALAEKKLIHGPG